MDVRRRGQPLRGHAAARAGRRLLGVRAQQHLNIGHRHLLPTYPALCTLPVGPHSGSSRCRAPGTNADSRTRTRAAQEAQPGPSREPVGVVKAAGVATIACWHGTWESPLPSARTTWRIQSAGGRSIPGIQAPGRQLTGLGTGLALAQAVARRQGLQRPDATPCIFRISVRPAPSTTVSSRLCWPVSSIGVRRRRPLRSARGVYCVSATVLDVIGRMFYTPEYESDYQAAFKNMTIFRPRVGERAGMVGADAADGRRLLAAAVRAVRSVEDGAAGWPSSAARDPDAMVGYSILIYRLTDADVRKAVGGAVRVGGRRSSSLRSSVYRPPGVRNMPPGCTRGRA